MKMVKQLQESVSFLVFWQNYPKRLLQNRQNCVSPLSLKNNVKPPAHAVKLIHCNVNKQIVALHLCNNKKANQSA